jgi:hypothetical protein
LFEGVGPLGLGEGRIFDEKYDGNVDEGEKCDGGILSAVMAFWMKAKNASVESCLIDWRVRLLLYY